MKYPGVIDFDFDQQLSRFTGECAWNTAGGPWIGVKDQYATLVFQRNPRSSWQDSKEVFSAAAGGNNLPSMIRDYFCPEVVDGRNSIDCRGCQTRAPAEKFMCLKTPPSNLL